MNYRIVAGRQPLSIPRLLSAGRIKGDCSLTSRAASGSGPCRLPGSTGTGVAGLRTSVMPANGGTAARPFYKVKTDGRAKA